MTEYALLAVYNRLRIRVKGSPPSLELALRDGDGTFDGVYSGRCTRGRAFAGIAVDGWEESRKAQGKHIELCESRAGKNQY